MDQTLKNRNIHLQLNNDNLKELCPKETILVANKREKNLLMRSDPYNTQDGQQLKEDYGYTVLTQIVTPAITLLMKQLILNVMLLVENTK